MDVRARSARARIWSSVAWHAMRMNALATAGIRARRHRGIPPAGMKNPGVWLSPDTGGLRLDPPWETS